MTAQAGPTPGPYTVREESHGASIRGVAGVSVGWFGTAMAVGANGSHHVDRHESAANARISAQALTVLEETGRTPRQLAEERAELLAALEMYRAVCGNTGYALSRESAFELYESAGKAIAKTKGDRT